jgi:O-antigen/teichoic acid export membrane protein
MALVPRSILKHFFIYASGSALLKCLSLGLIPLLLRVVSPEEYGILALAMSIGGITSHILDLGLRQYLLIDYFKRSATERLRLILDIIIFYTSISMPILATLFALSPWLIHTMTDKPVHLMALCIVTHVFFSFFAELFYQVLRNEQQVLILTSVQSVVTLGTMALNITIATRFHAGALGMLIGYITGLATATIVGSIWLVLRLKKHMRDKQVASLQTEQASESTIHTPPIHDNQTFPSLSHKNTPAYANQTSPTLDNQSFPKHADQTPPTQTNYYSPAYPEKNLTVFLSIREHCRRGARYLPYSLPLLPTTLLSWVLSSGDKWILALYATLFDVGIYALGDTVGTAYHLLVLYPLASSYIPYLIQRYAAGQIPIQELERQNKKIMVITLCALTVGSMGAYWLGRPLMYWFLPAHYHPVIPYIPLLLVGYILLTGTYFLSALIQFHNKRRFLAYSLVIPAVVNLALNRLLVPQYKLYGSLYATITAYALYFGGMLWYNMRLTRQLSYVPARRVVEEKENIFPQGQKEREPELPESTESSQISTLSQPDGILPVKNHHSK